MSEQMLQKFDFSLFDYNLCIFDLHFITSVIMSICCVILVFSIIYALFNPKKYFLGEVFFISFAIFSHLFILNFVKSFKIIIFDKIRLDDCSIFTALYKLIVCGDKILLSENCVFYHLLFSFLLFVTFLSLFIGLFFLQINNRNLGRKHLVPFKSYQMGMTLLLTLLSTTLSVLLCFEWIYSPDTFELFLYNLLFLSQSISWLILIFLVYKLDCIENIREIMSKNIKPESYSGKFIISTEEEEIPKEKSIIKFVRTLIYPAHVIIFIISVGLVFWI